MQTRHERLKNKIERTKESMKTIERIVGMLNPPVFGEDVIDSMHAEKQYERLNNRLNRYQTKLLRLQYAS